MGIIFKFYKIFPELFRDSRNLKNIKTNYLRKFDMSAYYTFHF
jgi:hypothetical protein